MDKELNNHLAHSGILLEIEKLFPFYFKVDRNLVITGIGASLSKLIPGKNSIFHETLQLLKPKILHPLNFESLQSICSGFVLIKIKHKEKALLRGQFEYRAWNDEIIFYGSLWADDHDVLINFGLTYSDFPAYDAIFDIQQMKSVLRNEQEDLNKLKHELDIINHSGDLFIHLHPSGLIRKASPSCKSMLGYEQHEIVGRVIQNLIKDQNGIDLIKELSEINKINKTKDFVTYIIKKNGDSVGVNISISPVINSSLNTGFFICIIKDISDRIKDLEEISNLASFPNENPNPIFRIDGSGIIKFRNRAANTMTHIVYNGKIHSFEKFWSSLLHEEAGIFPNNIDGIVNNRYYNFRIVKRVDCDELNIYGSDISERRESEMQAQETFNKLNNFLESTNDVYYLIYQQNKNKNFFTSRWPLFMGFNPASGDMWEQKRACVIDEFKNIYDDAMKEFMLNGSMTVKYKIKNKVSGQIRWILEESKIKFDSTLNDEIISGRLTDITANENFRSQMKESEERFQLITESMPVMIWVSNEEGKVTYTNKASRDFFGFDLKTISGQSEFAKLVHPDHRQKAIIEWGKTLNNKVRGEIQYLVLNAENQYRWIYEIAVPRFLQNNEFLGYIGAAFDITNEKSIYNTLEEEKKKYELLSTKSADIIFLMSNTGIIEYVSPSINRILNMSEQDIIGHSIFNLIEGTQVLDLNETQNDLSDASQQQMLSFKMKDKQGELKWVEAVYSRFTEDELGGKKILMHVRDINEQYLAQTMLIENEAKYRSLFSNMNLGIMEVDKEEKILYVNKSFERISGYHEDELIGKLAPDIFLTDLSEKDINLQERRNREHGKEGLYEIKVRKKDKSFATWVISGAPTYDMKGKIRGSIGIHWDVTEIRDLETKILFESVQKEKELMEARLQAEEEQRDVIGRDLHDGVGQMLAYLSLYFNILKEKDSIAEEDIDKAQVTIKKTIDEVRRLSRNLAPPAIKDLGFREAVIELINSYSIIPKPAFQLKIYKGKDPDRFLHEHKIMMFRVIQELSSNTFKYAHASKVEIKIDQSENGMVLNYHDNGMGFEIGTVKKGIGLKSILSRVEFYGGEVKIKTKPGTGFEVLIKLPFE
jgi:PAS domain S-box-containing protein